MVDKKLSNTGDRVRSFPYELLWEELGGFEVTIRDLMEYESEFQFFSENWSIFNQEVVSPKSIDFWQLVEGLNVEPPHAETLAYSSFLIAGFYLAPQRRKARDRDLASVRQLMEQIGQHAHQLYELSNRLSTQEIALLDILRKSEPAVFSDKGQNLGELGRELHDLALVVDLFVNETAPRRSGRSEEFVRDTAIRLTIEALRTAGLDDLVVSRGTARNPNPHLKGKAGHFLKGFFALVAPNMGEGSLAPLVGRVRRNMKT